MAKYEMYRGCLIDPFVDVNRPFYNSVANEYYFEVQCSKYGEINGWTIIKGKTPGPSACCRQD